MCFTYADLHSILWIIYLQNLRYHERKTKENNQHLKGFCCLHCLISIHPGPTIEAYQYHWIRLAPLWTRISYKCQRLIIDKWTVDNEQNNMLKDGSTLNGLDLQSCGSFEILELCCLSVILLQLTLGPRMFTFKKVEARVILNCIRQG